MDVPKCRPFRLLRLCRPYRLSNFFPWTSCHFYLYIVTSPCVSGSFIEFILTGCFLYPIKFVVLMTLEGHKMKILQFLPFFWILKAWDLWVCFPGLLVCFVLVNCLLFVSKSKWCMTHGFKTQCSGIEIGTVWRVSIFQVQWLIAILVGSAYECCMAENL